MKRFLLNLFTFFLFSAGIPQEIKSNTGLYSKQLTMDDNFERGLLLIKKRAP